MKRKNTFWWFGLSLGLFFMATGIMIIPHFGQAQVNTDSNFTVSSLASTKRQQLINELKQVLILLVKELEKLIVEQSSLSTKNNFVNDNLSSSSSSPTLKSDDSGSSPQLQGGGGGAGGNLPFGGYVNKITYCTCTAGYWKIEITPAKSDLPDTLMYSPFSATTYAFYKIPAEGVYLLGTHGSMKQCLQLSYPRCTRDGQGVDVIMVGTSN